MSISDPSCCTSRRIFRARPELSQESLIAQVILLDFLYAFFTVDEALGWLENFALYDEISLPTLHALLVVDEFGGFGPHSVDMLKIVLELLDKLLVLHLLISLNILQVLALIILIHFVCAVDNLSLTLVQPFFFFQQLSHFVKLIIWHN